VSALKLSPGLALARLEDLPEAGAELVDVETSAGFVSLVLTRSGTQVSAFENRCPHAGYPLQRADRRVLVQEGRYLVCGAHGASYELETGACAGGPCNGVGLTRIAVVVRDGVVKTA
jgi:nitrite reductase/ring-hydroxylating ferredoxin subunit